MISCRRTVCQKPTWILYGFFLLGILTHNFSTAQIAPVALASVQRKMVKVYGSGGFANLHAYQSGIFVDDKGTVVTVWSHVLDGKVVVVDNFGKRSVARFVAMDPETELAVLETDHTATSFFDLNKEATVFSGLSIFGVCNLFGIASQNEQQSVMSGVVSGRTKLDGKSGKFDTTYQGEVIIVDLIINNPGAAGGSIVDRQGTFIGLIGKELKEKKTGLWLNFCLPTKTVKASVSRIQSGAAIRNPLKTKVVAPFQWKDIGLEMVPQVLKTTRPFVDRIHPQSIAEKLGFEPDDLLVFIDDDPIRTLDEMNKSLKSIDRDQSFRVTLRRDNKLLTKTVSRVKQ